MSAPERKFDIPFTQYVMPHGRKRETSIPMPEADYRQWEKVRDAGLTMGVELLSDYVTVSQTIEDRAIGADFDIELCANGPEVPKALSKMLARFDPAKVPAWRKAMT